MKVFDVWQSCTASKYMSKSAFLSRRLCNTTEALLSALHVHNVLLRTVLFLMLKSQTCPFVTLRHHSLLVVRWHTYCWHNKAHEH
jgi:hypothetical protein